LQRRLRVEERAFGLVGYISRGKAKKVRVQFGVFTPYHPCTRDKKHEQRLMEVGNTTDCVQEINMALSLINSEEPRERLCSYGGSNAFSKNGRDILKTA
jgi:hypothetical protein